MGTEHEYHDGACPCGKGLIVVDEQTPDHPYGDHRPGFVAHIECTACRQTHVIVDHDFADARPFLVLKSEADNNQAAKAAAWATDREVAASAQGQLLAQGIATAVTNEPTAAARHRKLVSFGLTPGSLATFRKHGFDPEGLKRRISGARLAEIGSVTDLADTDKAYFTAALQKLAGLEEQVDKTTPTPIVTGIHGMRI